MEKSNHESNHKRMLRKKLLIYPAFQLKLIGINLLIMFTSTFFVYFFIKQSYNSLKLEGMAAHLGEAHPYYKFLEYQSNLVYSYLFIALAISVVVSVIATLIISNKLAGPIVRLHTYFKHIADGAKNIPAVFFRKNDFFLTLPPLINAAIERLKASSESSSNSSSSSSSSSSNNENKKEAA